MKNKYFTDHAPRNGSEKITGVNKTVNAVLSVMAFVFVAFVLMGY